MEQERKEAMEQEKKETLVFEGVVIKAFFGADKYDKEDKYRITIKSDNIPYTDIWVFDDAGPRFTPTWLKEMNGYISLKSNYEIPVKSATGRELSWDDWEETGTMKGSTVRVKIRQKLSRGNGAIYPVAIKVITPGIAEDPFEDM